MVEVRHEKPINFEPFGSLFQTQQDSKSQNWIKLMLWWRVLWLWSHGRFTTICVIIAYHYQSCEFKCRSWRGVLDKTLCDSVSDLR